LETSRSKERYGLQHRTTCGLCCQIFLPINLVLAVPLKAVIDIRSSWGDKYDPEFPVKQIVPTLSKATGEVHMVRVNKNLSKAPACYDKVMVCGFCAQMFTAQQDIYRPSYEAKASVIRAKEEEEDLARRKAYWDPLTTTEKERSEEMEVLRMTLERGDDEEQGKEVEEEEVGENVRLARRSLLRTSSTGRIVRERVASVSDPKS
jgi:hypothetical protein